MKYYIVKTHRESRDALIVNEVDNYVDARHALDEHMDEDQTHNWVYGILPAIAHSSQHVEQEKNNAV